MSGGRRPGLGWACVFGLLSWVWAVRVDRTGECIWSSFFLLLFNQNELFTTCAIANALSSS